MPCDFCDRNYNFKPCEYVEDEHYLLCNPDYDFYKTFVLLQDSCPCINCLVKVTCTSKVYCQEYIDTILRKVKNNAMQSL